MNPEHRAQTRRTRHSLAHAVATTTLALAAVGGVGLAAPAQAAPGAAAHHQPGQPGKPVKPVKPVGTVSFGLPDGFAPEGIAIDRGVAFTGSRLDGDIVRTELSSGRQSVLAQGPGTPSLGMKVDRRGRLFVAGGTGGDARVIDTRTGRTLRSYDLVTGDAFINDVVLTRDAAYFTDSSNAQLFAVPLGRGGQLPQPSDVRRIPLGGAWVQGSDLSANGITETPDGRALLVVNSANGVLYRVDKSSGVAQAVDLGGTALTNGDGLLLEGRTLYAVQNQLNRIAVVELARDGRSGRLTRTVRNAAFDVPTTVARSGSRLYLPNARFSTPVTPSTTYSVTGVEVGPGPTARPKPHGPKADGPGRPAGQHPQPPQGHGPH